MALNDVNTQGKYCPINGFNPPCGLCMFAIESGYGQVACAIPAIAVFQGDNVYFKNIVERINDDNDDDDKVE